MPPRKPEGEHVYQWQADVLTARQVKESMGFDASDLEDGDLLWQEWLRRHGGVAGGGTNG